MGKQYIVEVALKKRDENGKTNNVIHEERIITDTISVLSETYPLEEFWEREFKYLGVSAAKYLAGLGRFWEEPQGEVDRLRAELDRLWSQHIEMTNRINELRKTLS